jgi:hypothetical protein
MEYSGIEFSQNGIVNGIFCGQYDRVDELNSRYVDRQFPDTPLKPNYDPRPISTKYALFPCIAGYKPIQEELRTFEQYDIASNFNPGTQAPWNGFSQNIDVETSLRNQSVAIQSSEQKDYIPDSNSDLYKTVIVSKPTTQPYPLLFERPYYVTTLTEVENQPIGKNTFYNHTRTQLRSL